MQFDYTIEDVIYLLFNYSLAPTIIYIWYCKDCLMKEFLSELQDKLYQEYDWKYILDDIRDGLILLEKNFKIFYSNKAINKLLGL